ncbi:MAG: hypothetical protein RLZZ383_3041 [Pseudomonadota bacterium]|jgi:hypothetical protein
MRVGTTTVMRWLLLGSAACAGGLEGWSEPRLPTHRRTAPEGPIPVPPPPTLPVVEAPPRPTGARALPGGYPDVEPNVSVGQMLLLPGRATVDRYFLHPDLPVHYELGTVMERGRAQPELVLISRTGAPTQVPGALVVPLGTETTPEPGTWVLMPRASGYGWTRAVVTVGAADSVLLAPVPADPEIGTLSATRALIVPITQGDVGATLACRDADDGPWTRVTVFGVAGSKLLHLDDNDHLGVHHASACIALDLAPEVDVGDTVLASHFGTFEPAKVIELTDGGFGARVAFASTGREVTLALLDMATALDTPGTGFSKRRIEAPVAPPPDRPKLADAPVVLETIPSNASDAPISEADAEAAANEEVAGDGASAPGTDASAAPEPPPTTQPAALPTTTPMPPPIQDAPKPPPPARSPEAAPESPSPTPPSPTP